MKKQILALRKEFFILWWVQTIKWNPFKLMLISRPGTRLGCGERRKWCAKVPSQKRIAGWYQFNGNVQFILVKCEMSLIAKIRTWKESKFSRWKRMIICMRYLRKKSIYADPTKGIKADLNKKTNSLKNIVFDFSAFIHRLCCKESNSFLHK